MMHKAKKSLGQNFLKSEAALRKIIEAGEISSDDIILEIGPGKGVLTKKLLLARRSLGEGGEGTGCVIAVEKDRNLVEFLKEKFTEEIKIGKLILLEEDILEFNLEKLEHKFFSGPRSSSPSARPDHSKNLVPVFPNYKIIANIPYNITGAILKKFLTEKNQPKMMVLMVQNEVAKRIMARDGKESILSISVKAYGTPKMEIKVPARYFSPAPKVDSAIISIKNISRNFFVESSTLNTSPQPSPYKGEGGNINEDKFWEIIHAGFAHKRKKLVSNLKKSLKLDEKTQKNYEKMLGNKRAEDLTLTDWFLLTKGD